MLLMNIHNKINKTFNNSYKEILNKTLRNELFFLGSANIVGNQKVIYLNSLFIMDKIEKNLINHPIVACCLAIYNIGTVSNKKWLCEVLNTLYFWYVSQRTSLLLFQGLVRLTCATKWTQLWELSFWICWHLAISYNLVLLVTKDSNSY